MVAASDASLELIFGTREATLEIAGLCSLIASFVRYPGPCEASGAAPGTAKSPAEGMVRGPAGVSRDIRRVISGMGSYPRSQNLGAGRTGLVSATSLGWTTTGFCPRIWIMAAAAVFPSSPSSVPTLPNL